jgi:hypothetical protein
MDRLSTFAPRYGCRCARAHRVRQTVVSRRRRKPFYRHRQKRRRSIFAVAYVRIVASVMPREMDTTARNVELDRMSDQQLNALIARYLQADLDPAAKDEDEQTIQ